MTEKQIFWKTATPDDFKTAGVLDWIEGVGDISTHYEKRFVNVFGEMLLKREDYIKAQERERIITLIKKVDDGGCPYDLCSGSPGEEVGNCRECLIDWLQKSLRGEP